MCPVAGSQIWRQVLSSFLLLPWSLTVYLLFQVSVHTLSVPFLFHIPNWSGSCRNTGAIVGGKGARLSVSWASWCLPNALLALVQSGPVQAVILISCKSKRSRLLLLYCGEEHRLRSSHVCVLVFSCCFFLVLPWENG